MPTAKSSWYSAGQGSISSLACANLMRTGIDAYQIAKDKPHLSPTEVILNGHSKPTKLNHPTLLNQVNTIDKVFVALKAYDILNFVQQIVPYLSTNATVVLCHNGMGTIQQTKHILGTKRKLYFCTTSNGAFKEGNTVHHVGNGPSYWAQLSGERDLSVEQELALLFDDNKHQADLLSLLWQKLTINCVINPLTAIHNCLNGELANSQYHQIINDIITEIEQVANAANIALPDNIRDVVKGVINNTAANRSSMYQDVAANRKTEIDFINGFIVNLASRHKIEVPINNELLIKVRQLVT